MQCRERKQWKKDVQHQLSFEFNSVDLHNGHDY